MTQNLKTNEHDWQLQHYAAVGKAYGSKHFAQAESMFTKWILEQIAAVHPTADSIAEVGAGTCVFASLLGKQIPVSVPVVCYEPVKELLEGATEFDNVDAHCGGALEFAQNTPDATFDLIFTKDTAHHFAADTLSEIHNGFYSKLRTGGRYLMVVRTPPDNEVVPVGRIASNKWTELYTPLGQLRTSMRAVKGWKEIQLTRWEKAMETSVREWIDGVANQDTWSVFSALDQDEIGETVRELEARLAGERTFEFMHQYDVGVYEKL